MARSIYSRNAWRYKRNLRALYARATDADKREGLAWYPTAHAGCLAWSTAFGVAPETIACIIAAISPQCDWTTNLRIAFELLSGQVVVSGGALRANVMKARAILDARATSIDGYFKDAPKVRAFSKNLGGWDAWVTVDSHAVQAAVNDPLWRKSLHPNAYRIFANIYADVARERGLRPCDFQAVIWCAWKRRHTTLDKQRMLARERARKDKS